MNPLSDLLLFPIKQDSVYGLSPESSFLIWNQPYMHEMTAYPLVDVCCVNYITKQTWKNKGVSVCSSLDNRKKYDVIFCAIPKQKNAAQYMIAKAALSLHVGGTLIVAAFNDSGGKRLQKWFDEIGVEHQSFSKNKARVVWGQRNDFLNQQVIEKWLEDGSQQDFSFENQKYKTHPGVFGWNKIDRGSKILVESLPDKLSGIGADYGCGYGYLSHQILTQFPTINKLYAMDADYNALECARYNLSSFDQVDYRWCDLTRPQEDLDLLDFIVMNPPFHDGKLTSSSIGVDFIKIAASCLKKNKTLYMVANNHLPYEKVLVDVFSKVEKEKELDGFKIFYATK